MAAPAQLFTQHHQRLSVAPGSIRDQSDPHRNPRLHSMNASLRNPFTRSRPGRGRVFNLTLVSVGALCSLTDHGGEDVRSGRHVGVEL